MHKYRNAIPFGWKDIRNQLEMVNHLEKKLGISKHEDWYNIKVEDFEKYDSSSFLRYFNHSIPKLLQTVYPDKKWQIWRFQRVPANLWDDPLNQLNFMQELGRKFGYSSITDWLSLSKNDIIWFGGGGLLEKMQGSLSRMLSIIYPEHPWKDEHFDSFSQPSLSDMREKLIQFQKTLNIKEWKNWYLVGKLEFEEEFGSSTLLSRFGTISNMVIHLLPEFPWKIYKFKELEQGLWKDINVQRRCIEDFAEQLGIKNWPDDWKKVLHSKIANHECSSFISYYYQHSLSQALENLFPEFDWKIVSESNSLSSRKSEHIMQETLGDIFNKEQ